MAVNDLIWLGNVWQTLFFCCLKWNDAICFYWIYLNEIELKWVISMQHILFYMVFFYKCEVRCDLYYLRRMRVKRTQILKALVNYKKVLVKH